MFDLGALKLTIKADSEQAEKELKNFKTQTDNIKTSLKPIGDTAKKASLGILAIGTAAVAVTEGSREYRAEQAKLDTAFETAGHSAESAEKTFETLNGVLGDTGQAVEASSHLAKLCKSQEELSTWTDIATGVYATFGDSLPIEGLTEAANETVKTGQLTGGLADALNWAGISEDEFQAKLDACNTEQERQSLIMETLDKQYKTASDNYKTNAEDIINANKANQELEEGMATLGEALEPVITTFKSFIADGVEKLASIITANKENIDNFVSKIKDFGDFILENADVIIALLVGIGTGLLVFNVASTIMGVVNAVKAFQKANETATIAQALLNAVMNANPFILIASLVAGVIAAIVVFIATNEEAREKIAIAWEAVKTFIGNAIDVVVGWFKDFPNKLIEFAENFKSKAKALFQKIKDGFSEVWETITSWFSGTIGTITSTITGIGTDLFDAGKAIFTSLWDGLKNVWETISSWVSDKVTWLVDKLAFWRSGKDEMDSGDDGSHRTGLREVPYDGYRAELHRGEMVLTASEANQYQLQNTNLVNAIGTQLALATQGGNQLQTINLTLDIGGTKFGETVVTLGDIARNAMGVNKIVKVG